MIYKLIGLNQEDLYKKVGNILNKVAESMEKKNDAELVSQYQPEDNGQDKRLLDDAFKVAVKKAMRFMSAYINNNVSDIKLDPHYLKLTQGAGASGMITVNANGAWALTVSESTTESPNTYFIPLVFPDTWHDIDVLNDNVEDLVTHQMIATYLESVDKAQAAWYSQKVEDIGHDIKTMCATRKPGTRFYVTSPFGENPYRRY